jgi:hypothetical protein
MDLESADIFPLTDEIKPWPEDEVEGHGVKQNPFSEGSLTVAFGAEEKIWRKPPPHRIIVRIN